MIGSRRRDRSSAGALCVSVLTETKSILVLATSRSVARVTPPHGSEATYYVRMQRFNTGPYAWPPPAMGQQPPEVPPVAQVEAEAGR